MSVIEKFPIDYMGKKIEVFNSIAPERLEGETQEEYRIRRKLVSLWVKRKSRGYFAEIGTPTKAGQKKRIIKSIQEAERIDTKNKSK